MTKSPNPCAAPNRFRVSAISKKLSILEAYWIPQSTIKVTDPSGKDFLYTEYGQKFMNQREVTSRQSIQIEPCESIRALQRL